MIFKIIGGLFIAFGLVDLVGSFTDFDIWNKMGIELPMIIWKYSAYIAIIIGFGIFKLGSQMGADDDAEEEQAS